ncbi:hypothetical protein HanOQP8_Chr08g0296621 [Helianthus annuus]|nr:hypothetical protein HanOQP8_Chr08g0296621 [Helianthus annuus]
MEVMSERLIFNDLEDSQRKERSWHTCFESIKVQANGSKNDTEAHKYPVELVKVRVDSWKTVKPQQKGNTLAKVEPHDGMDLEFDLALSQDNDVNRTISCALEHLKISSKQPVSTLYLLICEFLLPNPEHDLIAQFLEKLNPNPDM